jgi:hypothetical protein
LRYFSDDWDVHTINTIIEHGDLCTVKWLISEGCPCDKWSIYKAAIFGHLDILKWFYELGRYKEAFNGPKIAEIAAKYGHMDILLWMYKVVTFSDDVTTVAAKHNHWSIVKWLVYENMFDLNQILINAIQNRAFHIVSWCMLLFDNLPFSDINILKSAVSQHSLGYIEWLINLGFIYSSIVVEEAAKYGRLDILKWMKYSLNIEFNEDIAEAAASSGNLSLLNWLHEEKCPFNSSLIVLQLAKHNNIALFEWALKTLHVQITREVLCICAGEGNLEVLKWLFQYCPYDFTIKYSAILRKRTNVVEWLNTLSID